VSREQRIRAMKRNARNRFYRNQALYGSAGITNWRMLIARQFQIPVVEVRHILESEDE
jgi:hypothetical protein